MRTWDLLGRAGGGHLWVLVDLRVHVETLRVEDDDVVLPDLHRALVPQVETEVLLDHADVHGGRGQAETFVDGAL